MSDLAWINTTSNTVDSYTLPAGIAAWASTPDGVAALLNPAAHLVPCPAAWQNRAGWPIVETRDALNDYQIAGAPVDTADAANKRVVRNYPATDKPLADLRAVKKAKALAAFAAKIAAGRNHADGHNYQLGVDKTGTPAIINLTAMAVKAEASIRDAVANPWSGGFTFRNAANVNVAKTAAQMFALATDCGEYVRALRVRLWAINDAVDAAASKAAVDAIDENAGWPAN